MSVGLSAGLRCLEEEGRARSIPSAARPWRGGWGRAGGHRTLAGAGWEGWTRRCPGQRAGCHPANTGSKVTDQNTRQRYEGQGYIFIGGKKPAEGFLCDSWNSPPFQPVNTAATSFRLIMLPSCCNTLIQLWLLHLFFPLSPISVFSFFLALNVHPAPLPVLHCNVHVYNWSLKLNKHQLKVDPLCSSLFSVTYVLLRYWMLLLHLAKASTNELSACVSNRRRLKAELTDCLKHSDWDHFFLLLSLYD